jgi:hypothetical protein
MLARHANSCHEKALQWHLVTVSRKKKQVKTCLSIFPVLKGKKSSSKFS